MYTQLLKIGLLAWLLVLAACGSETAVTPTPILPPPNISAGGEGVAGGATLVPGVVPSVTPEGNTAVTPTPTLAPTNTPTPTAEATAVTNPPTQAVTAAPLPVTGRDLLFLAGGAFRQWNHNTRQIETILPGPDPASRIPDEEIRLPHFVGDITGFVMSADGKRAVIARLKSAELIGEPGGANILQQTFELLFMDMISRELWTLVPQIDNLGQFALSADAQQLAFTGTGMDGARPPSPEEPLPEKLYVMPTGGGNPGPIRQIRLCEQNCAGLVWHPDDNLLAFGDREALWLFNLAATEPELWLANSGDMVFTPLDWARNGRYLMLWKGGYEGGSRVVLDVPTRQLADVPNTFAYAEPFPVQTTWLPDDRLYVLRSLSLEGALTPTAELWRIQPENGVELREEWATLSDQPLGVSGQQYLEDGRFAYVLFAPEANPAAGTYILKGMAETPQRVNAVPPVAYTPGGQRALWAADGSGALIVSGGRVYYAPAAGEALFEVTAVLGGDPAQFQWQPEIVVP
ncbi:MAG TPA: hypothetical protein ENK32_02665 [Anaerolineae bacterium]|nr:hypothetical protein [Anaerolineae bacterium]